MAVTSIAQTDLISALTKSMNQTDTAQENTSAGVFSDIFKEAMTNVTQTDQTTKLDQLKIATGQSDDLHTLTINSAKAELALKVMVQMRNKALDAYNEVMRISL